MSVVNLGWKKTASPVSKDIPKSATSLDIAGEQGSTLNDLY